MFRYRAQPSFYTKILGFTIRYQREEEGFAMVERQGAMIMLDQIKSSAGKYRSWISAPVWFVLAVSELKSYHPPYLKCNITEIIRRCNHLKSRLSIGRIWGENSNFHPFLRELILVHEPLA
jgi:hypothetical protein